MSYRVIFLLMLIILCVSLMANAQSSFALRNIDTTYGIDAPVFDAEGQRLTGVGYRAELYGGATSNSLMPLIIVGSGAREIVPLRTPGYFYSNEGFLSVSDVPPRGWAWLQLRVWDSSLAATYEEMVALGIGGYGESPLFYAQGHDPLREPPESPAPLIGLQSFSLRPIPEPGTLALVAVSGLCVLFVRRWRPRRACSKR